MALSSLFYGMEAYLDGDVEINNNVTTPEEDAVAAADQSAEIASDAADANSEAKDNEVQAQMLVQMSKLYTHVKTYGIDRTFLSIYNANGELDRACGIRFPSCETFSVTGNPRDQYSTRFIAATKMLFREHGNGSKKKHLGSGVRSLIFGIGSRNSLRDL